MPLAAGSSASVRHNSGSDMLLCAKTSIPLPASSTAGEREFEVGKGIQTQTRGRLLPANLETRVFL